MFELIGRRASIGATAQRNALSRRSWAVVGNGANRVAAQEIRIKLSELCYKSIACDVTEDKKHIDLSAEPMILVCAAGLRGSNADDVAKEIAIYRAHKAAPIAIVQPALALGVAALLLAGAGFTLLGGARLPSRLRLAIQPPTSTWPRSRARPWASGSWIKGWTR